MKYFTFLLVALFLFLNVAGVSQEINKTGGFARISAMGANPYIVDPYFNSVNPAWNAVYSNFILADLGSAVNAPFSAGGAGQYLSGSFKLTDGMTLGGILTRNDFNAFSIGLVDPGARLGSGVVSAVNDLPTGGYVVPLDNNVEIIGTYTMGSTSFGLGVAYASTTNDITPAVGTGTSGTASQIGFNAGIISDLTRSFKLDLGVSLIMPSASFKPMTGTETKASQTIILANARVFWNLNKNLKFVPVAAFATSSGTLDSGGVSGSADMLSLTQFSFGAGLNYQVGDFLLAGGATFNNSSVVTQEAISGVTPELTSSVTVFPIWNIGAEWNMTDWFVARLGYVALSGNATIESFATTTTVDKRVISLFAPSQRGITVGVGFRLGDFSLDATVNEDVLRQGFNNIGGGGSTFSYLTASYALP